MPAYNGRLFENAWSSHVQVNPAHASPERGVGRAGETGEEEAVQGLPRAQRSLDGEGPAVAVGL